MNSMRVTLHENPVDFSAAVSAFLVEREVENCVLLGRISEALAAWPGTGRYESPPLMLSVESEGRIVAAGTMDIPHSPVLSEGPAGPVEGGLRPVGAARAKPP